LLIQSRSEWQVDLAIDVFAYLMRIDLPAFDPSPSQCQAFYRERSVFVTQSAAAKKSLRNRQAKRRARSQRKIVTHD
jgi:hypothetical protein